MPKQLNPETDLRVMRAIRRIIRAVDIHSRLLLQSDNFTTPQLVALLAIAEQGPITLKKLSQSIDLSPSTVVGIVDRLESGSLIRRTRNPDDRRQTLISITQKGQTAAQHAPFPLQHRLLKRFHELSDLEQTTLALALERVVDLMGAEAIDASAILDVAPIQPPQNAAPSTPRTRSTSRKSPTDAGTTPQPKA
ncbi:Transcriptional regulator, MarR family [gamma proteobacterium HdN1]|nr:Transcriptional regulator, MarR family [gamma proteobacterium HdN1]